MNRWLALLLFLFVGLTAVYAQGDVAQINGVVTDPQGSIVPGAAIEVMNVDTGAIYKTTTNEHGEWLLAGMGAATYRVTVTANGFAKAQLNDAPMHAGVPLTVNAKLEVGSISETVSVTGAADLLQATTATLATTVQTQQVTDIPYISRGGMDLFIGQPGVQTTGANRLSTIDGLPQAAINVTLDGINVQTNTSKDTDGFFALIPVRQDSLEEITLTTAATGADANAQGATTVRFVTKSGTNQFHGGVFEQLRNTDFNANSYFNNINGLARNREIINQFGGNIGGPIIKNKLLFFTNLELFRYPATGSESEEVINPADINGTYTYPVAGGGTQSINVLNLAKAAGFNANPDPIVAQTLQQIEGYYPNGILQSRVASNSDYNRYNLVFSPKGITTYWTDTSRIDYNINSKNTLSLVYTYYKLGGVDDVTNNVFNIFPGTGAIVGENNLVVNQSGNRYAMSTSLRSSISPRMSNELRFGLNRGLGLFRPQVSSPSQFSEWRGYAPSLGFSLQNPYVVDGSVRYKAPVRELHDALSYQWGTHSFTFGGDATKIDQWYETLGTSVIPTIGFGAATNDPVVTGATNLFTATSMPGSTSTYQSDAAGLYALLTGRVSSIGRSVAFNGQQYGQFPQYDIAQQYEYGFYASDSWKVLPSLTITAGLRFEVQQPYQETQQAYSSVSIASLWGISGVGNLFNPNANSGQLPTYDKYNPNYMDTPHFFAPSLGLAWQLPGGEGFLGWIFGKNAGDSVLRAGGAIATIRDAGQFMTYGDTNQGLTYTTSLSPSNGLSQYFGAAGSVLFSQPTLPYYAGPPSPQYPISPTQSNTLYTYDPHLQIPYVESWNLGFQRRLSKNTAVEVRYTGNHGVKLYRVINENEINTFENGFQTQFYTAQENLFINRGCSGNPSNTQAWNTCSNPNSTSFANAGLPGQSSNIGIITTAFGGTSDTNTSTALRQNNVGSLANTYATNTTDYGRLVAAGYRPNLFQVNPNVSGADIIENGGFSTFNSLQIEVNRRLAGGLLVQGSYVFAKNLGEGGQPTTLRNWGLDKSPVNNDIRDAFKINALYQLPFGTGRHFVSGIPVLSKILEGWEIAGISRIQSGAAMQLTSGRDGMDSSGSGVVLENMNLPQLQNMIDIQKITPTQTTGAVTPGQVLWLPQSLINNTNSFFETNGMSWATLNTSQPYIGAQLGAGQYGYEVFVRNPWQYHFDVSVIKRLRIKERVNLEITGNFDNILNYTNFLLGNQPSSSSFGHTTSAYNDLSYNYDPGSRVVELKGRISF